jgi:hypothetical protein
MMPEQHLQEGINMRSAIILGLGGTGLEVMMMVRRMIVERYGSLNELPIIAFLHLDTDAREAPDLTPTNILGEDIGLRANERVTLKMPQITDGGAAYLSQHPMVKEWFPPNLRIEHDFSLGAGAVRAFGRLAFSESAQRIETALSKCIERVNEDSNRRYVAERWAPVDPGVDVYIVCSLLGGTGSGTFIDAAYLARDVVKRYTSTTQILGFIVVGGGSSVESPNLANCYAALKELVYYSTLAQKLKQSQASAFSVQYPRMPTRLESGAVRPFDFCYLVTNFNEKDVQLAKEELFELVAQNIFLEFTPGVAATKRSIRNNIAAHSFGDLDRLMGQAQSFLSFGIATIEFPALRVQDCLAYRLAGEATSYWGFLQAPADTSIPQQVKVDLQEWGLDIDRLLKALITDNANRSLIKTITDTKNQKLTEFQRYVPRPYRDELIVHLRNFLDGARKDVDVTLDPTARGAHIKQIEIKAEQLLNAAVNMLRRKVAEKISSPYGGTRNALTYLQTMKANLDIYKKSYQTAEEMQRRKVVDAADKETKAFARVISNKADANDSEMRVLISDALNASLQYSEATILEYANRQARLLLVGEKDAQGRWICDCLLKEIEQMEGQIANFTNKLSELTREFVGQKERDEAGREVWNGGKYRELYNNLTKGAFNTDVLVDPSEIDKFYEDCVKNPSEEYIRLKEEVERRIGGDTPLSILWCVLQHYDQVKRIVFEASRKRFGEVKNISIAKKLSALGQPEVDRKIEEAFKRSHVLLRFDESSLFATDEKTGDRLTGYNPGFHSIKILATCHPQYDPDADLKKLEDRSKLAIAFQTKVSDMQHDMTLPDRYRLVFVQEKGVFPLYCVADFRQLREAYIYETRQQNAKPRETNYKIPFPDLFPQDPREKAMPTRVERALTLGRIFGLVREGKDVETEEPAILYSYRDEHYTLREINLGRTWEEAAQQMTRRQIDKEVYRQRPEEVTPLEHLENALREEGMRPRTISEKEKAWEKLQLYLLQLAKELEEGERHPRYQKESAFINSFRDEFGWRPPRNWRPPEPEDEEAPPTSSDRNVDEEEFRQRVRILVRNRGGQLQVGEITRLMQEAIEDYKLKPSVAKRIIDEEQRQNSVKVEPDPRSVEKYRQTVLDVTDNGTREISDEGRQVLEAKRKRLGLTPEQASAIEAEVLRELYKMEAE